MVAEKRRARLAAAMADVGLDYLVVYGNAWQVDYLRYACDFAILEGQGLALVTQAGDVQLFLDLPSEVDRAQAECPEIDVYHDSDITGKVAEKLSEHREKKLGAAPLQLIPQALGIRHNAFNLQDSTELVDRLLMIKMADELELMRTAAALADDGYRVFKDAAREGRADYELIAEAEAFFRANGVEDNFMIIGVGGPDVRGMAPPSGRRLAKGDLVTTELSPSFQGYYGQICRTLVVGEPSDIQRQAFEVFNDALLAGLAALRPGATASTVAKAENDIFRANGLGDYVTSEYTRVRGHGLGLFLDTKPHILEGVDVPLVPGMSIIVHPNTYHPRAGYLVHGDMVLIREQGPEVVTATPRELFVV